jgi:hypothetical protein
VLARSAPPLAVSGSAEENRSRRNWLAVISAIAALLGGAGALIAALAGVFGGGGGTTATPALVVTSTSTTPANQPTSTARVDCAPSYPDVCIPPPPPDLTCKQVSARNFRVLLTVPDPDPHGFDGNHDGVGCQT